MDWVHEVVHGPGPHGWSMDLGPSFVYVLARGLVIVLLLLSSSPIVHKLHQLNQGVAHDVRTHQNVRTVTIL